MAQPPTLERLAVIAASLDNVLHRLDVTGTEAVLGFAVVLARTRDEGPGLPLPPELTTPVARFVADVLGPLGYVENAASSEN